MNVTLQNGSLVRGDDLIASTLRSDLSPIPLTLECIVRSTEETDAQVIEGNTVIAGRDGYKLMIVKVQEVKAAGSQDGRLLGARKFIALYEPCHKVSFTRSTAVIKEKATLGGIYGACGASVTIDSDFTVDKFTCFVGGTPTYGIARALQEEGGSLVLSDSKLKFVRLRDIFKKEPFVTLANDSTQDIESGFLERHEVPTFFSLADDGEFIYGNRDKVRQAVYAPRTNDRVLVNMTKVLVHAKTFKAQYEPDLNAGDLVRVEDKDYAVVTAAHVFNTGGDGGNANQFSKFWLATLED